MAFYEPAKKFVPFSFRLASIITKCMQMENFRLLLVPFFLECCMSHVNNKKILFLCYNIEGVEEVMLFSHLNFLCIQNIL